MSQPRNVIVIVADSLRFDSVYRYNDIRLPYVQGNSTQFTQARSSGCWTLPATAALFTGKMPHEHGATTQSRAIYKDIPTLAEQMKNLGYATHQVTANIVTTDIFGLDRGFDDVRRIWNMVPAQFNRLQQFLVLIGKPRLRRMLLSKDALMNKMSSDVNMAKTWLQYTHLEILNEARKIISINEAQNKQSFVFLNLMESHFPYHIAPTFQTSSNGFVQNIRELVSLFHTLNQTFLRTGKLKVKEDMLEVIRRRQRKSWEVMAPSINQFIEEMHKDKDNLVVFLSDHGDNFGEQGWLYHFSNVTDAGNKVPFFWLNPQQSSPKIVNETINSKDLYHSIVKACGGNNTSASVLDEPEESKSVLQSYWYNNHNKTLDKFKYNQICFIEDNNRYLYREGNWFTAPVTKNDEQEQTFTPIPGNVNPIEEKIDNATRRKELMAIFNDFTAFADKIGNGKNSI